MKVAVLARGPHPAATRRYGVRVRGPRGDFTARPRATDDPAGVGPADHVFPGLEANSYAAYGPLTEPLPHDTTIVVAARNGIPRWYVHRYGGPYDGRRPESVDPGGAVGAVPTPERAVGRAVHDVPLAAVVEPAETTGAPAPTPRTVHALSDLPALRSAA